jgi:hypothetical protein
VINSHDAGFTVIDLINNTTNGTFSSGIAVWDTNHEGKTTNGIRVIGNTITKSTTWDLAAPDVERLGAPPHEVISIGGAVNLRLPIIMSMPTTKKASTSKRRASREGSITTSSTISAGREFTWMRGLAGSTTLKYTQT